MRDTRRSAGFWALAGLFGLFVLFLYGPMFAIFVLSFQGPEGGLVFPMRGASLHWFIKLAEGIGVVDIWAAFRRSLMLGTVVMVLTVVLSLLAGLAFRRKLRGGGVLFYLTVASLIMPSIIVSLGIGLQFRLLDSAVKGVAAQVAPSRPPTRAYVKARRSSGAEVPAGPVARYGSLPR